MTNRPLRLAVFFGLALLFGVNVHSAPHPTLGLAHTPAPFLASPRDASVPQGRLPIRLQSAGGGGGGAQLQVSDLSCTGAFLTPLVTLGSTGGNLPVAMRYESAARHYFMMDGSNEHIMEFPEPTLSSCATALASMNRASFEAGWGGDWGAFLFGAGNSAGGDATPGFNGTGVQGMHFDASGNLVLGWSGNYSQVGSHNSFGSMALNNGSHTLSTNGCWGFDSPLTQPYAGQSMIVIPAGFVASNLSPGHNFGVVGGFPFATVGAGISEGPTIYAIAPPASNACTASTDTFISSGMTLEQYSANGNGPSCSTDVTNGGMGCTPPTTTISTPYPKQIAYTNYSRVVYATDWEPYPVGAPTHGWVGFDTFGALDWYDDGTKHGVVTMMATPEGWIKETVVSSTDATHFVSSATSTHDGLNINVGDVITVQTCTVGVDPGCNGDQSHLTSQLQVSAINTSTHAMTVTILSQDQSTGNHFPVPGGSVVFGCQYSFGTPTCSRWELRAQIDDPNDLALVAGGSKQPYDVVAADDQEIDQSLITNFGSPTAGNGSHWYGQQTVAVSSVIADPTAHDVMVVFQGAGNLTFFAGDAIFVLHVNESVPMPSEMLGSMGLIYLLSLAGWGRLTRRVS